MDRRRPTETWAGIGYNFGRVRCFGANSLERTSSITRVKVESINRKSSSREHCTLACVRPALSLPSNAYRIHGKPRRMQILFRISPHFLRDHPRDQSAPHLSIPCITKLEGVSPGCTLAEMNTTSLPSNSIGRRLKDASGNRCELICGSCAS